MDPDASCLSSGSGNGVKVLYDASPSEIRRADYIYEVWPLLRTEQGDTFWCDEDRWGDRTNPNTSWWAVRTHDEVTLGFFSLTPQGDVIDFGTLMAPGYTARTTFACGELAHDFLFSVLQPEEVWHRVGSYNRKSALMLGLFGARRSHVLRKVTWGGKEWEEWLYVIDWNDWKKRRGL